MKIFGTIEKTEKQTDGTMIVMGYASSESKDVDGEIIKADAIKNAIPDYMKFANVREMHKSDKASGTVLEMEVQSDGRTWVKTHIVDAEACKKVDHKVYKGFSIGGRVTERDENDKSIIKSIKLSEISLVDRPANPDSIFTFAKVDEGDGAGAGVDATKTATDAQKPDADATKTAEGATDGTKKPDAGGEPAKDATGDSAGAGADKTAAAKPTDLKKGMWAVQNLASILGSIQSLQESAEWEAESEGDGSTMPTELMAWLKQGGTLLSAMVTEEVAEMVDDGTPEVDILVLAEKATNLMKAACSPEDAAKFETWAKKPATFILAKAGKRNSKTDQKHLDAIHDSSVSMGATCGSSADKSAGKGDDLKKVAGWMVEIAKAVGCEKEDDIVAKVAELVDVANTLAKKVTQLEAMPKPPKAAVQVVEKGADSSFTDKTANADAAKDGKDALKKVWGGEAKVG